MRMNFTEDHMLVRRVKTEHDWRGFPSALNPYLYCKRKRQDSEGQDACVVQSREIRIY